MFLCVFEYSMNLLMGFKFIPENEMYRINRFPSIFPSYFLFAWQKWIRVTDKIDESLFSEVAGRERHTK